VIVLILEFIIVLLLVIFAVENIRSETYNFLGITIPGNVWWTVAGSALLGFLFAVLALGPGRVAAGWRNHRLGRQGAQTGQELATLQAEHAQLQAEHALVVNEREQYRAALASATQANGTDVAPVDPVLYESVRPTDTSVRNAQPQTLSTPVAPTDQSADQPGSTQGGQQRTGWRGAFQRLRTGENPAQDDRRAPNARPPSAA